VSMPTRRGIGEFNAQLVFRQVAVGPSEEVNGDVLGETTVRSESAQEYVLGSAQWFDDLINRDRALRTLDGLLVDCRVGA